ncbi:hypothetical protein K438DRAFT_1840774 [Mycena galopus ATCC 62051]|nr:hypothetical protein K438DRAFT_1840774 [Mycena galopus ATCC 62051]
MDNNIASKLYRAGSIVYVLKSGGMSNELNNILSLLSYLISRPVKGQNPGNLGG